MAVHLGLPSPWATGPGFGLPCLASSPGTSSSSSRELQSRPLIRTASRPSQLREEVGGVKLMCYLISGVLAHTGHNGDASSATLTLVTSILSPHSAWLAPDFSSFSFNIIFETSSMTSLSQIAPAACPYSLLHLTPCSDSPIYF